jgi:hypothetical protein
MAGTGADVTIGGVPYWNLGEYSVVEDATPLDPSDLTGGFGQITMTSNEFTGVKRIMGKDLVLSDGALGTTAGVVRGLSGTGNVVTIQANSRLGNLAVERTIPPFTGTLTAGITALLALCGITTGINIDAALGFINVKLPGGRENVHDRLKKLTAAYDFEVSLVSNIAVARVPRQRVAVNYRDASINWTLDQNDFAQNVGGWYYNHVSGTDIAYPLHGAISDVQPIQVDAAEEKVQEIPLDASLSSVVQPACVSSVTPTETGSSKYSVVDNAGVIVQPSDWTGAGGSVRVKIGVDTRTLIVTVVGANIPTRGPFRIGQPVASDVNNYYSTLRIVGTGIFWDKKYMGLEIVEDTDLAPDEVGAEVDNEFFDTADQLYHRLLFTAARYGTDSQSISVSSGGINRLGTTGSAVYPTIGDVAAAYPGATIGTIFTSLGPKISNWNATLYDMVDDDFSNQAFGNIAGARVLYDNSYYRIRSATTRSVGIDYSAERDNIVGDVYRTGETIGQWNTRWSGYTIRDVNIAPLRGL